MKRVTLLIAIVLVMIFGVSNVEYNIANSHFIMRRINYTLPQGWNFFTRNSKEFQYDIYKMDDYKKNRLGSVENYFGLSRKARFKFRQHSMALESIKNDSLDWKTTLDSVVNIKVVTIDPIVYKFLDTGINIVKKYQPIPWAWINRPNIANKTIEYSKVKFTYGK